MHASMKWTENQLKIQCYHYSQSKERKRRKKEQNFYKNETYKCFFLLFKYYVNKTQAFLFYLQRHGWIFAYQKVAAASTRICMCMRFNNNKIPSVQSYYITLIEIASKKITVCCNSFAGHMRSQSHFDRFYFLRCVYNERNEKINIHERQNKAKFWA